jgi:hypothetical protein
MVCREYDRSAQLLNISFLIEFYAHKFCGRTNRIKAKAINLARCTAATVGLIQRLPAFQLSQQLRRNVEDFSRLQYLAQSNELACQSYLSNLAWALMGLCALPELARSSVQCGIAYLLSPQRSDGIGEEDLPTGLCRSVLPQARYYRKCWPLRALAIYTSHLKRLS